MSNDYYNASTTLTRQTLARAATLNAILQAIASGFAKLPGEDPLNEDRVCYGADTGTANTYAVALDKTLVSYTAGLRVVMKVGNTNTGASTLNVDGVGARSIKRLDQTDPEAGDLTADDIAQLVYDGTNFILMGPYRSHLAGIASNLASNLVFSGNPSFTGTPDFDELTLNSGAKLTGGTGSPEGSVTAPVGSIYTRTDGASVASPAYLKIFGTGNTGWTGIMDRLTLDRFGSVGDGSADDAAVFQAALDYAENLGGADIWAPWPSSEYLIQSSVLIPNNCRLVFEGQPNVLSGGQQVHYDGSDAAFALKAGESDESSRGLSLLNAGIRLSTAGATGFRFWRVRDLTGENLAVRMEANSQIGFHFKGEKAGGTKGGVFDCAFRRLASYDPSGALTGALHYKLSGTLNDGQVNANLIEMIRGGGSGQFCEIGPSTGNTFIGPEAEAIDGDYFDFLANAYDNRVFGGYVEAVSGWTGKIVRTHSSALRNECHLGTVGVNTHLDDDLSLTDGNRVYWAGRVYTASSTNRGLGVREAGDSEDGADLSKVGLSLGDGSTAPVLLYGLKHRTLNRLTLAASITPDADNGYIFYLDIDAATDPSFNTPSNVAEGEEFVFHIKNNSGSARTLTWDSSYVKSSYLPSSLSTIERFTAKFYRQGSKYYLLGDWALM